VGSIAPVILDIKSREELKKVEKKLAYSSLIPPIFSLLFIIICIGIQMRTDVIPYNMRALIFEFTWSASVVNIVINIFALVMDCSGMSGGYRAFKKYINEDLEAVRQIALYISLSNMGDSNQLEKINNVVSEVFDNAGGKTENYIELTWYLDKILYQSLLYDEVLSPQMELLINENIENLKKRNFLRESEVVLLVHTIMYVFKNDGDRAVKLWNEFESKIPKAKLYQYYRIQIEGLLFGKKESLKGIGIRKSSMDNLFRVLENYFNSEDIMVNRIIELGKEGEL
jgi:hypothetical protein